MLYLKFAKLIYHLIKIYNRNNSPSLAEGIFIIMRIYHTKFNFLKYTRFNSIYPLKAAR